MPDACAISPPLTFLPSSNLAFNTSIEPPWAVTLKLCCVTSVTSPIFPGTSAKRRKRVLRASKICSFLPLIVVHAPGPGLHPANQVVDVIDGLAHSISLRRPAPAFITRLRFILRRLRVLARQHQIRGFQHSLHTHAGTGDRNRRCPACHRG